MAKYFVNRGGGRVPEGPFEEQQIVRLILAGKLKAGYVGEEGLQRFTPLEDHPLFEQALAQMGIVPPPEALEARARPAAGQQRGTNRGMLFGAVLAFFGLAIGAVAIGTYVMFNTGGMPVHAAMPGDTELLFEITSVRGAVGNLSGVRGLDTKKLSLLDDTTNALSASFGVPKVRVSALVLAASSLGIGARKLASAPEGALVLTFSSATPVNAFLNAKRFTYYGLVATNGRKYKLAAATPDANASDPTAAKLSALKLDDERTVLVWFETSKVLFLGSPRFAVDVSRALSLDAPSLDLNPQFKAAQRDWVGKPDAVAYLDPKQLGTSDSPLLQSVFGDAFKRLGPASGSITIVPAGVLTHAVAHVSASTPDASQPPKPRALTASDHLPVETFAYVAIAENKPASGAEMRRSMFELIGKFQPALAAQAATELEQGEARFHVKLDTLLGAFGEQCALGVLAPSDYRLGLVGRKELVSSLAIVYLQAAADEGAVKTLIDQFKAQLGPIDEHLKLVAVPDGIAVESTDPELPLSMQLRLVKGYLFVALGNAALAERGARALSADENTLGAESAQRAARAALPHSARLIAWLDAGRIVETARQNPFLAPSVHNLELDRDVFRWGGPDRLTMAVALNVDSSGSAGDTDRIDALNLPLFAGFLGSLSANR